MTRPDGKGAAEDLRAVLEDARRWGFLGPGPVEEHIEHATAFATALAPGPPVERAVDLGSGGGLPGLVMATILPESRWTLLDANQRRTSFLSEAVTRLGMDDRVAVVVARAEVVGRDAAFRGRADLVAARSFGAPPVAAECAAPLLGVGGQLVVSEPPAGGDERWDAAGLGQLGMVLEARIVGPPGLVRIRQAHPCPDRFPRRTGVPSKRPLW